MSRSSVFRKAQARAQFNEYSDIMSISETNFLILYFIVHILVRWRKYAYTTVQDIQLLKRLLYVEPELYTRCLLDQASVKGYFQ